MNKSLNSLNERIIRCVKCQRLVNFRESVALKKTKRFIKDNYWGKPVIGFNTGGTAELIGKFKNNLFDSPKVYFDNNYILRIHNWEPNAICKRIFEITNDYKNESEEIKRFYKNLDLDMNCNKK